MPRGYIEYLDKQFEKSEKKMIEEDNTSRLIKLIEEIVSWHKKTFPEATEESQVLKLDEELKELKKASIDGDMNQVKNESIDVVIVSSVLKDRYSNALGDVVFSSIMDKISSVADFNEVVVALENKFEINKKRKWTFENGVYRHIGEVD